MKKFSILAVFALVASSAFAANVPVNIVYPIDGQTYTNYFTSSFSVTCPGGPNKVLWYLDGINVGHAEFYDQTTVQFTQKLPGGQSHELIVKSSCGSDRVKFVVQ